MQVCTIYTSIRDDFPYGISPGGIPTDAYNGHMFWDMETWMYPNFLLLNPALAESMLEYRFLRNQTAQEFAKKSGYSGYKFPWESAYTGLNVCPDSFEGCLYEDHISGDVAFATWQYYRATRDTTWLKTRGFPVLNGVAEFWASRVVKTTGQYEIWNIVPPAENVGIKNNSIYTNVVAQVSLKYAGIAGKIVGKKTPDLWDEISQHMSLPFDAKNQRHVEFDGYDGGLLNQADVALLQYPLMQDMTRQVAINDLIYYQSVTNSGSFFTGNSAYSIAWLALGDFEKAQLMYNRAYLLMQKPFFVWREILDSRGNQNFLTGAGGYLQNMLFGYGGFRLTDDELLVNPILPITTTFMKFRSIHYLGNVFSLTFDKSMMTVEVELPNLAYPLFLKYSTQQVSLSKPVTIPVQPSSIFTMK